MIKRAKVNGCMFAGLFRKVIAEAVIVQCVGVELQSDRVSAKWMPPHPAHLMFSIRPTGSFIGLADFLSG